MTHSLDSRMEAESFETLARELPLPILVAGAQGDTRYANTAARQLFGVAEDAAMPSVVSLLFADAPAAFARRWGALLRGEQATEHSCWQLPLAGRPVAEVRVKGMAWCGERALQITLVLLAGETDTRRETLYRQMFTANPAVKLLIDPHSGAIIDANPAAAAFYGYSLDALKRLHIADINGLSADEIHTRMAAARAKRQNFFEFRHRTARGEVREVHAYSTPISVGEREYLHSIIVDVTDTKRYCAELEVHHALLRNLPVGVYRSTPGTTGRFLTANPAMLAMFEAPSFDALAGVAVADIFEEPKDRAALSEALLRDGAIEHRLVRLRSLRGRRFWAEVTAQRTQLPGGEVVFDGIVEDVTARNAAEVHKARLMHLLDASPDLVSITDAEQRVTYLNRAAQQQLGELPDDLPGALAVAHPEWAYRLITEEGIPYALAHGHWYAETALWRDGQELPVSQLIVARYDAQGELDSLGTIMRDISDSKRYQARLEHLAGHDPLTGAVNRNRFLTLLARERAAARRRRQPLSLAMFDIDHFKRVNDTYGHSVGDAVLCELVRLCAAELREVDVLARWGGEEFMLLLPDTALDGAVTLAERLRQIIEAAAFDPVPRVTCSFGVAELMEGEAPEAAFKRVDEALYAAKATGRNRVNLAAPATATRVASPVPRVGEAAGLPDESAG